VRDIISRPDEVVEVDPLRVEGIPNYNADASLDKVRKLSTTLLDAILSSEDSFPPVIRHFLNNLKRMVEKCFPESKLLAIGSFVFLRFICPSIFSPEGFGITKESPNDQNRRTMIIVSKVIQNLANGVSFQKEQFMLPLNDLIDAYKDRIMIFLNKISEIPPGYQVKPKPISPHGDKDTLKDLALITRFLDLSLARIESDFEKDARMESMSAESKQKNRERLRVLKNVLSKI